MMQGGPVLPVRFGTAFSSEQKLDDVMALNEEALSDALDHVDGCVELSVHVLLPAPENSETVPQTGRQYMLEKLAAEQALQRVRKNLHDALAPLAEDTALRVAPGPDLLFSAAYLVRRDKTEDFRRRLLDLTAAHDHLRTLCTGPWPPYHFVPKLVFPPPSPSSHRHRRHRRPWRQAVPDASGPTLSSDRLNKILNDPGNLDEFVRGLQNLGNTLPSRVNADPQSVERGLAKLVLTLIDLLRQLMERQAIRRMEGGSLTDEEIERLGQTFMLLEKRLKELRESFGLQDEDLNLDLGPLGKLM
jgi:hypothetical protein